MRACPEGVRPEGPPRRVVYAIEIVSTDGGYAWVIRSRGKTLRRSDRRCASVAEALRAAVAEIACLNRPAD